MGDYFALTLDQQLSIAHDVHEQDVSDLGLWIAIRFGSHLGDILNRRRSA